MTLQGATHDHTQEDYKLDRAEAGELDRRDVSMTTEESPLWHGWLALVVLVLVVLFSIGYR